MRRLLCIIAGCLLLIASARPVAAQEPWMTRTSIRHVAGDGVGHTNSFSSLDWFLPLSGELHESHMWFGDFRGLLFNDGEFGSNVGSGFRWYVDEQDRIYGFNAYWDTRQDNSLLFNQAGLGIESLGRLIDVRANAYTPAVNDSFQRGRPFFAGKGLARTSVAGLSGADAEAGINLPPFFEISTSLFAGGYFFDSNQTTEAAGWRVRAETVFRDDILVGVSAQDDDLFGTTINAVVELRSVYRHSVTPSRSPMRHKFRRANGGGDGSTIRHRLADPVHRQQNIVLKHRHHLLTTPGGAPLTFLHVVPGGTGTGTFEDPYGTLSAALLDPLAPTSVIYTPFGGAYVENVMLVPGTRLFSNGPAQFVSTNQGTLPLPFSGSSPSLTALPSSITGTVTLAANTTLSGFDITGPVTGTGITGSTLSSNRIQSAPADALTLTGSNGITIDNLLVNNAGARGIVLNNTSATLSRVTSQNNAGTALEIKTTATDRAVTISNLTITNPAVGAAGVDVNVTGAGNLDLSITDAAITSRLDALNIGADVGATGDTDLRLNSITASSTHGAGIVINQSAGTGTTTVTSFAGNTVTKAANGGVLFDTVVFDANTTTAGIQTVSAGTLAIGTAPGDITGDGLSINNSSGTFNAGVLTIFNNNGTGLFVENSPMLSIRSSTGSTIDTKIGAALDLASVDTDLTFTSLQSENSPAGNHGIHLDAVTGRIRSTTTNIVDSVAPSILIENIAAAPMTLRPQFGTLTIESLIDGTQPSNIQTPGVTTGIVFPIFTSLNIVFP